MKELRTPLIVAGALFGVLIAVSAFGAQPASNFFPPTDDEDLQAFFDNPRVKWGAPHPVFQLTQNFGSDNAKWSAPPPRLRLFSVHNDIGPEFNPRATGFSNGNGEWPWAHPATLNNDGRTKNIIGYLGTLRRIFDTKLQNLEVHDDGKVYISNQYEWIKGRPTGMAVGKGWTVNEGFDVCEIVTNSILNEDHPFKVHRMTLTGGEWVFRVYRPFTTQEEYEEATGTQIQDIGERTLRNPHQIKVFEKTAHVQKAPRIDPRLARKLVTERPFRLCTTDFVPTSDFTDQVWPKDYLGPFIGNATNQADCRSCHQHVLRSVRGISSGEWYGFLRGGAKDKHGAGLFSWYPREILR